MTSALTTSDQKYATVRDLLQQIKPQLALALPKHVSADRLMRIMLTQIRKMPKLLDCTRDSLLGAIFECAQLGLEPGTLGQAWIIPYGREATLLIGYRGMVGLAWRSNQIASVFAKEVYDGDLFDWSFGLEPKLSHRPNREANRDLLTHAYAVIKTTNGGTLFDVMSVEEIEVIRNRSRAKNSGPWVTDYAEMVKKTVLRRLLKLAPCSAELQRAVTLDEQAEYGIPQDLGKVIDMPENGGNAKDEEEPEYDPETGEVIPSEAGQEPSEPNVSARSS